MRQKLLCLILLLILPAIAGASPQRFRAPDGCNWCEVAPDMRAIACTAMVCLDAVTPALIASPRPRADDAALTTEQRNRALVIEYHDAVYEAVTASVARRVAHIRRDSERETAQRWMLFYVVSGHAGLYQDHLDAGEYDEAGQVVQQLSRAADVDLRPDYVLLPKGGFWYWFKRALVFVPVTRELYKQKVDPATFQPIKEQ